VTWRQQSAGNLSDDEMEEPATLKQRIKDLMVENLMLQVTAAEIGDSQALFGPGSLGLDSVDALQLVVALDKNFGLKIPDPGAAKEILQNVETIASAVAKHRSGH
jgi:acyl carrier protein